MVACPQQPPPCQSNAQAALKQTRPQPTPATQPGFESSPDSPEIRARGGLAKDNRNAAGIQSLQISRWSDLLADARLWRWPATGDWPYRPLSACENYHLASQRSSGPEANPNLPQPPDRALKSSPDSPEKQMRGGPARTIASEPASSPYRSAGLICSLKLSFRSAQRPATGPYRPSITQRVRTGFQTRACLRKLPSCWSNTQAALKQTRPQPTPATRPGFESSLDS